MTRMPLGNVSHSKRIFLPHKAVSPTYLRAIEAGVIEGWRLLRTDPPSGFNLATDPEEDVTTALYETVVNRVLYPGIIPKFTYDLFRVVRELKVKTYDGRNLKKMPDMFFHLIDDRRVSYPDQDGVFAECKPVDRAHPVGSQYCDRGVRRFVVGQYGWAMREAIMIAYAVTGFELPDALTNPLGKGSRPIQMPLRGASAACKKSVASVNCQQVHSTTHIRNFIYPDTGKQADDILIRHIWLCR